ncbi:MAG: DUF2203 family protein [Planctomycetota bacterium]|nr:DUF2203 family protein [Planctomycetota bacterium]
MNTLYDRRRATRLVPFLDSITREILERSAALERLEARIAELESRSRGRAEENDLFDLVADAALHRRELRYAKKELDRLGCSIVGTEPLTIRIPGRQGASRRSFVWRSGDPVLR